MSGETSLVSLVRNQDRNFLEPDRFKDEPAWAGLASSLQVKQQARSIRLLHFTYFNEPVTIRDDRRANKRGHLCDRYVAII